ncbi:hypothetical protein NMG60_11007291 [Bertholletia excelsa]
MARMVVLFALCVLPALVNANDAGNPFTVIGRVYCDTCRTGFETDATPGIPDAVVRIECRESEGNMNTAYTNEGVTDATGIFKITVNRDCGDEMCDVVLVKSPLADCAEPDPERNRARVILTRSNGLISNIRYCNALGFLRNEPINGCTKILEKYNDPDSE